MLCLEKQGLRHALTVSFSDVGQAHMVVFKKKSKYTHREKWKAEWHTSLGLDSSDCFRQKLKGRKTTYELGTLPSLVGSRGSGLAFEVFNAATTYRKNASHFNLVRRELTIELTCREAYGHTLRCLWIFLSHFVCYSYVHECMSTCGHVRVDMASRDQ